MSENNQWKDLKPLFPECPNLQEIFHLRLNSVDMANSLAIQYNVNETKNQKTDVVTEKLMRERRKFEKPKVDAQLEQNEAQNSIIKDGPEMPAHKSNCVDLENVFLEHDKVSPSLTETMSSLKESNQDFKDLV